MATKLPRIVIAGLTGDSGKTIVSLSLAAALVRRGLAIAAFKKGPDYIDAAWLGFITKSSCRNLDTYLVPEDEALASFCTNAADADLSLIEGNRGIFDGKDVLGTHSTAGLAKLVQAPVVLVVDVTKTTRTTAALIKGIIEFDREVLIVGVILNRVGSDRHRNIITQAIERYCNIPVLGAIPKLGNNSSLIPGRHLGLVPPAEYDKDYNFEDNLNSIAVNYINIDKIVDIANNVRQLEPCNMTSKTIYNKKKVTIGYFKDSVFTFYYPENLESLKQEGAELIGISSINDDKLPAIDALYIGGGFPEMQAEKLVSNQPMMNTVKKAAVSGMPIYAECGGLIYLARSLAWRGKVFPMTGVFPVDLLMHEKPIGHGYTSLIVDKANPYFNIDDEIRGHEFHYSGISENQNTSSFQQLESCLNIKKGTGLGNKRDGLLFKNTMACYTHIHALGNRNWAKNMVKAATNYKFKIPQSPAGDSTTGLTGDDYRSADGFLMATEA